DRRRPRVRAQTAHRELFREERLRMTDGTRTPPRVVVWRWGWLAPSETFIRSQLDAYDRWVPFAVGAERIASSGNSRDEDRVLFGRSPWDRALRFVFKAWDWSPRLHAIVAGLAPDVIHAHFGGDASRVRRIAKHLRTPFVVTLHGADVT